ncbi:SGNH/GDSL hydrolase family protein [Costertonia aggregata]|uniref:SGNH/GDSL hydrolase family protein n=1 Tax=Costertonia aggregata TaxID=343403 RepID=A0A7H9ATA6_9FLAO|nr:SGNH/GDSL hydrolase family protein [Costertonia aggregata]QLG46679.1 SGNH/GDSL hydrolase family protein [Costertonia aggregata]
MKKLFIKLFSYGILFVISLEILVRVFHLAKDTPVRFADERKVEKWVPNQKGHSVTGNRRQNFSEYRINSSGFNSYREFSPSREKVEIALVGDSFIEGFHQNYYNSIGRKIENKLPKVEVYEYGYAGYDLADQLHLINVYKEQFDLIDIVILGLKFENDLTRPKYEVVQSRLALESKTNRLIKKSKLLVYLNSIGVISNIRSFVNDTKYLIRFKNKGKNARTNQNKQNNGKGKYEEYLKNFESLVSTYGFDKKRFYFLIDETITPSKFLDYLKINNYRFIKIGESLKQSEKPVTLIYDRHWNDRGRDIVAKEILKKTKHKKLGFHEE